ncbi:MAG: hypothetical protein ACR2JE_00770 [Acidobacteriaceae bacterium]
MRNHLKALATCVLVSAMANTQAQTTAASGTAQKTAKRTTVTHTNKKAVRRPSVESQIQELRQQMQQQNQTLQQLQQQLSDRDAQLQQAQQAAAAAAANAQQAQQQAAQQAQTLTENTTAVSSLQGAVSDLKTNSTSLASTIQETQTNVTKKIENPEVLHYKGITLSPAGSFLAAETVWRQRATGSDINTPFSAIPLNNQEQAQLSEFQGTGRQSRVALLAEGKLSSMTLRGYYEADWLGTGITSNNNQSNSYVFRQRQVFAQAALNSGWTFTGGQMWSLVTETKKGLDNRTEALPQTIDPQYAVGFNWERQYGFRVTKSFNDKFWLGASAENAETLNPGGRGLPSNYVIGSAGTGGGLYNSTANYSYNLAPDIIVKAAAEPSWGGHYELYGIARFFRNRIYPNVTTNAAGVNVGTAAGAFNDQTVGGGVGGSFRVPTFHKRLDLGLKGEWGDGTNRYDDSQLSDLTIRPNGQLALIHGYSTLGTAEWNATPRLDVYANYGIDGTMRRYFITNGKQSGYGAYTALESGCNTETIPAAGSAGFIPSALANCNADNRDIQELALGYWYDFYKGPKGRLRQGIQYSYFQRQVWSGTGGAEPHGTNNMFWTSLRYYLP